MGARLAQVGLSLYGDREEDVVQIEDSLITGILRSRLAGVEIEMLEARPSLWSDLSATCPWINHFRQTFFNEFVLSKKSSRNNVQYVGSVDNLQVWRFFLCCMIEAVLNDIEKLTPAVLPDFVWSICSR